MTILGTGLAGKAQKDMEGRAYRLYAQEAKATGDTPLTPEEWAAQQAQDKADASQGLEAGFSGKKSKSGY